MKIGVNLTSIGVSAEWWLDAAARLEAAGFDGVWCWDHFVSRGRKADPVLECWTTLAMAAVRTERIRVGSYVTNVMNRHPAVLARIVATITDASGGRAELGIGIGGHPAEHAAYGLTFPERAERVARLEEAVTVVRLLWTGGPVSFDGRYYRLDEAWASPVPVPAPRIVVGGGTPAGARLAAQIGDAWTTSGGELDRLLPIHREALASAGRALSDVPVVVGVGLDASVAPDRQPLFNDLLGTAAAWRDRGADELILDWIRPRDLPHLLTAAERAGLP